MLPGMSLSGGASSGGGGGGAEVSFIARNAYNSAVTPTDVSATWSTNSAGTDASSGEASRTWLLSGLSSDYQLFVSLTSGTLFAGTAGSWLLMNATLTYTCRRTNNIDGFDLAELSCQVRRVSDLVVISTFLVTLTAEVLP